MSASPETKGLQSAVRGIDSRWEVRSVHPSEFQPGFSDAAQLRQELFSFSRGGAQTKSPGADRSTTRLFFSRGGFSGGGGGGGGGGGRRRGWYDPNLPRTAGWTTLALCAAALIVAPPTTIAAWIAMGILVGVGALATQAK